MQKYLKELYKSVDEIYKYIALTEECLKDLEERVSALEKDKKDEYYE